jgi:hypothetical protein
MAETIVSPGVFTRENDQSFITEGPLIAGAAIVGPTAKGPIHNPTIVTSYSNYKSIFGGSVLSGSQRYNYFTSIAANNYFQQGGEALLVTRIANSGGSYTSATGSILSSSVAGAAEHKVFTLRTLAEGEIANSSGSLIQDQVLETGSEDNVRFEVSGINNSAGTFNLFIRRGNDTISEKVVLEQFLNLSLDPFSPNYLEKVIGNQKTTLLTDDAGVAYLQLTGSYPNRSRFVSVDSVANTTPNYLDAAGTVATDPIRGVSISSSLPIASSGSFSGGVGTLINGAKFYSDITNTNTQGVTAHDYSSSISLLSNKDLYNYGVLAIPGLIGNFAEGHVTQINAAINNVAENGDAIFIMDPVEYGTTSTATVTGVADGFNTSYAAAYWPWVQTQDPETGQRVFVPASTFIPGVYAFNDNQRDPWFAPAGLQRGALGGVIRAEKALTKADRDNLYEGRINPIATFSNAGVVVFGQKTLQKKASALDRINVRRLLIALKQFIGGVGRTLVFENNTTATRNSFLAQVTPYLESVQQRQGLFAFKVVMDDTNNTPDIVDRNQLVGQVFIQPAKTAEFVILDFTVLPTGVEFPS